MAASSTIRIDAGRGGRVAKHCDHPLCPSTVPIHCQSSMLETNVTETRVYPDRGSMAAGLAEQVASELTNAIKKRGRATLAVPGGETPRAFYQQLSEMDIEWACVTVILTDEHYALKVPDKSNAAMIRELLVKGAAAEARFLSYLDIEVADESERLTAILAELEEVLPIDVCILGVGVDSHIASLYATADKIEEALGLWAPNIMLMDVPQLPEQRLTLTAPVLERARKAHILLYGDAKKQVLREAQKLGPVEEAPVRVILNRARATTVHYAD